jgi:hypothetical protein
MPPCYYGNTHNLPLNSRHHFFFEKKNPLAIFL